MTVADLIIALGEMEQDAIVVVGENDSEVPEAIRAIERLFVRLSTGAEIVIDESDEAEPGFVKAVRLAARTDLARR